MSKNRLVSLSILVIVFGIFFQSLPWTLDSNMTNFLAPASFESPMIRAQVEFEKYLGRRVIFAIRGTDWVHLKKAAESFASSLTRERIFSSLQLKLNPNRPTALWRFYLPFRQNMLLWDTIQTIESGQTQKLVDRTLVDIFSPWGGFSTAALQEDPLGLYQAFLKSLKPNTPLELKDGFIVDSEAEIHSIFIFGLIDLESQASLFDLGNSMNLKIQNIEQGYAVEVARVGAPFYAYSGVQRGLMEAKILGVLSFLGVLLLIFLFFRTLPVFFLTFGTLFFAGVLAASLTQMFFGSLHIFALIAGTTIIGLCSDYIFHFCALRFNPQIQDGHAAGEALFRPLGLSFISSVLGYSVLFFIPLPGLRQLACFVVSGLTFSAFTVLFLIPKQKAFTQKVLTQPLGSPQLLEKLSATSLGPRYLILIPVLLLLALLFSPPSFDDNIRNLQNRTADLVAQENWVKKNLGSADEDQTLIFASDSTEKLLQNQESVFSQFPGISRSPYLAQYLPSRQRQHRSREAFQKLNPFVGSFYQKLGSSLKVPLPPVSEADLLPSDLRSPPLSKMTQHLWYQESQNESFSAVQIKKVIPEAFEQLHNPAEIKIYKPFSRLSRKMALIRKKLSMGGLSGVIIVFLFLGWVTGIKNGSLLLVAPITGVLGALLGGQWLHGSLNVFHLLSCFLVFALGIDYSLFYRFSKNSLSTRIAINASFLTTLLSFGILSFSKTFAVASFGISLSLGLTLCYLLAPFSIRKSH